MLSRIVIFFIKIYQKVFSLDTGWLGKIFPQTPSRCRFYPTCSEYMVLAIKKYGLRRGVWMGIKRIGRCHPGNPGGVDNP